MKLTNIAVDNAQPKKKQYKLTDGEGLHLLIKPNGSKYWRYRYYYDGKEKVLAFGVYPAVSLKEARKRRVAAREQLDEGKDPSQEKRLEKLKSKIDEANTFESIAREWHKMSKKKWNDKYAYFVLRRLEKDLFPFIGNRPINEITAPELLQVLKKIEKRGATDLAHRVLQSSGQVFRYAIITSRAERDISADLKGALETVKVKHNPIFEAKELPEFLSNLTNYDGDKQTKLGLHLLLLTFVRTIELRAATWDEVDFEENIWRIPKERMKMRRPHIVPLSKQAVEALNTLKTLNGESEHLFPNRNRPSTYISENTLLYAMYRMGYHSRMTPHGLRGTASTILNENGFMPDVIERQLAHIEGNKVRAAYNHAEYLPQRTEMMQWWADFLDKKYKLNHLKKVRDLNE